MPAGPGVSGGFWPPVDDTVPPEQRPGRWHMWPHRSRPRPPKMTGPFRRLPEDGLAGGVAAGLAARRGMDPTSVRLALALLGLVTVGWAFVGYVVAWLLVPVAGADSSIASKARDDRRGIALAAGLASMLVALLVLVGVIGGGWVGTIGWPLVISAVGLVLIWRNASGGEQARMRHLVEPLLGLTGDRRPRIGVRLAVAGVLLIAGVAILASVHETISLLWPL